WRRSTVCRCWDRCRWRSASASRAMRACRSWPRPPIRRRRPRIAPRRGAWSRNWGSVRAPRAASPLRCCRREGGAVLLDAARAGSTLRASAYAKSTPQRRSAGPQAATPRRAGRGVPGARRRIPATFPAIREPPYNAAIGRIGRREPRMSIKSDRWIRRMSEQHGMIEPYEAGQVKEAQGGRIVSYGTSSYGYDVRCSREFKVFTNINSTIVDPKHFDPKSFVDIEA